MAKKGARELVALICSVCKSQKKLEIKKFCKVCRKVNLHKETTKLK